MTEFIYKKKVTRCAECPECVPDIWNMPIRYYCWELKKDIPPGIDFSATEVTNLDIIREDCPLRSRNDEHQPTKD